HALGNRARKAGQGILTVRFEMPFAIWCSTCPKPTIIGQGVRFNAEKKRVGKYHTTPIFSFRMKHNVCGGWIEIQTDPKNTQYVVTEGAKKRDTGEGKIQEGEIILQTEEEKERLKSDAFAALEVKIGDKRQAMADKSRIEELQEVKERDWDDPWGASKKLRRAFRADRKVRQRNETLAEELKDRMSLGLDLLAETEEDKRKAKLIEFGELSNTGITTKVQSKPLFVQSSNVLKHSKPTRGSKETRAIQESEARKQALRHELSSNTRVALDPFLNGQPSSGLESTPVLSLRRKRDPDHRDPSSPVNGERSEQVSTNIPLVDYDSD
ncbi:hypothetical protein MMC20_006033, partial [Loxospora ochrophaea]|nr:hypothetical protein [Loxospora ochrophaea]